MWVNFVPNIHTKKLNCLCLRYRIQLPECRVWQGCAGIPAGNTRMYATRVCTQRTLFINTRKNATRVCTQHAYARNPRMYVTRVCTEPAYHWSRDAAMWIWPVIPWSSVFLIHFNATRVNLIFTSRNFRFLSLLMEKIISVREKGESNFYEYFTDFRVSDTFSAFSFQRYRRYVWF